MKKKYKIANFTIEVISPVAFQESFHYSQFACDCTKPDYTIAVNFIASVEHNYESVQFTDTNRSYFIENDTIYCFYKSHECNNGYIARRVSKGTSINIYIDNRYRDLLRDDVIFSLSGIEEIILKNDGCIIHASFIIKDGKGILFSGPCEIGKSTQANLWREHRNATIANGDKALIFRKYGEFFVSGLPFSGSSRDCLNITVPLKAIVCLNKGQENSIIAIKPPGSFYNVYKNCYPVLFSEELTSTLVDIVLSVSERIPVFEYYCLPDESAVKYLESALNKI